MKFTAHRPLAPHFDNFYSVCRSYWPRWRASSYSGDLYISLLQCPHRFRIIFLHRTFFLAARGEEGSVSQGPKRPVRTAETHSTIQGAKSPPPTPTPLPTYLLQQKKINVEGEGEGNYLPKARPSGSNIQATGYREGKRREGVVVCCTVYKSCSGISRDAMMMTHRRSQPFSTPPFREK